MAQAEKDKLDTEPGQHGISRWRRIGVVAVVAVVGLASSVTGCASSKDVNPPAATSTEFETPDVGQSAGTESPATIPPSSSVVETPAQPEVESVPLTVEQFDRIDEIIRTKAMALIDHIREQDPSEVNQDSDNILATSVTETKANGDEVVETSRITANLTVENLNVEFETRSKKVPPGETTSDEERRIVWRFENPTIDVLHDGVLTPDDAENVLYDNDTSLVEVVVHGSDFKVTVLSVNPWDGATARTGYADVNGKYNQSDLANAGKNEIEEAIANVLNQSLGYPS